jgi:hypothetical protein
MARAQFKLLLFLITLGILVGCVATGWWLYSNVIAHDAAVTKDIAASRSAPGRPALDPGARRFDAAIDLIRSSKTEEARDALYKLLQSFPRSPTCGEAKRIIGEMNMDALYRLDASGGKRDYIVQPGDSLLAITGRTKTTLEALARINSLSSINLQPGEHLFVIPMDFDLAVDASDHRVTLLRGGRFFKEYTALGLKLPQGMKVPAELEVTSKSAIIDNKAANPVTADFVRAEKRLIVGKNANTAGLMIRTPPTAKAVDQSQNSATDEAPESHTGIFLAREDIEELYPILRKGARLSLVQ